MQNSNTLTKSEKKVFTSVEQKHDYTAATRPLLWRHALQQQNDKWQWWVVMIAAYRQTRGLDTWLGDLVLALFYVQGGHKVGEQKFWLCQAFPEPYKLTFPYVITTKSKCNNDLHQGSLHIQQYNRSPPHSTKYLNDELKTLYLLQFFPEVVQNSLRIPRVFHVQKNLWVFYVFQVSGHPDVLSNVSGKFLQWLCHDEYTINTVLDININGDLANLKDFKLYKLNILQEWTHDEMSTLLLYKLYLNNNIIMPFILTTLIYCGILLKYNSRT